MTKTTFFTHTHTFDIPLIHKVYKLYLTFYSFLKYFPKKDRYSLGVKCEQLILNVLELLFTANAQLNTHKISFLQQIDIKLKILKTIIRLAFDAKTIDQKKYLVLQEQLQEVGRMLGGWIKSLKNKTPPKAG